MAVLTPVTEAEARDLVREYALGRLHALTGIAGGSVNSNFAIDSDAGRVFLRVYEERDAAGARAETALLERLALRGVPTPAPLRRSDGGFVSLLRDKPAALFPWREGGMRCQAGVAPSDARQVGRALAQVHVAGEGEAVEQGRFNLPDLHARLDRIAASGDARFSPLVPSLRRDLAAAHAARDAALPRGLTHGDLFRDNVLWNAGGEIAALLDFESACEGTFAYDLMVTMLAWCVGDDLEGRLAVALREGYEEVRPLSEAEKGGLHAEARCAALRFTITRITDYAMREDTGGPRSTKDWRRFARRGETLRSLGPDGLRALLGSRRPCPEP